MRAITGIAVGLIGLGVVAAVVYGLRSGGGQHVAAVAPLSTPPGVTLQVVRTGGTVLLAMAGINIPATGTAYADSKGMTLYVTDKDDTPGKSSCAGDCATAFPPLAAPADAKGFADWSVIARDDGSKQWALKGKPLYTSTKDKRNGDGSGNGVDGVWHIATFKPEIGPKLPDGVALTDHANAAGVALVDQAGMPLYTLDDDKDGKPSCVAAPCTDHWTPYEAAQLARPVGDFTVVDRGDGMFQWAFKGQPLYSYDGDTIAGDANGNGLAGKWHVALAARHFMPDGVTIVRDRFGGGTLATAQGMTLYVRDRVVGTNTGHNLRLGSKNFGLVGRILGTAACDAECAKVWKPLVAAPDAQPSGYWEIATRDDGTRQWVYRGFAVYSYAKDAKPGDMLGNDEIEIMDKDDPFKTADLAVKGMGALYWHTATP